MAEAAPSNDDRLPLLNDVWKVLTKIRNPEVSSSRFFMLFTHVIKRLTCHSITSHASKCGPSLLPKTLRLVNWFSLLPGQIFTSVELFSERN